MSEDLLPFYNRELAALRRLGAQFAEAHPKIAGRLRLGADTVEDPHVSRLIESVAFLNARIRHKLDDDFPELTEALLGILYPHYLAPIPSMAIVQFECEPDLTAKLELPVGTGVQTDRIHGEPCRFRTTYPITTWPIRIESARLTGTPFSAPSTPRSTTSHAVLQISLATLAPGTTFAALAPDRLRFFLRGQVQQVHALYELLFHNCVEVALASSPDDPHPLVLPASSIQPVGFGIDEGMLPYPDRSFLGYRLLTEYFAFPAKFLFFDIEGLSAGAMEKVGKMEKLGERLNLYVYLNESSPDLEQSVSAESFALGCGPVVNLFERRAEPIKLNHTETSYRVVPDARRPLSIEVYSTNAVTATHPDGRNEDYLPLHGLEHGARVDEDTAYWHVQRRSTPSAAASGDEGTEVYLSLQDPSFRPSAAADWVLGVETTCLNRDLPGRLPFGGDQPRLQLSEGGGPIAAIRCLTPPTRTRRPPPGDGTAWRLISHLSLNHLSLAGGKESAAALREILRLYDPIAGQETKAVIDGLVDVRSRDSIMRTRSAGIPAVCRGTEITVELDERKFAGSGLFLFATILERFLGLYCSMNSFIQMAAVKTGREGVFRRWPPRAGDQPLV
jgi:type VI secretion system protein ImpG